jgi:hypothetical protein
MNPKLKEELLERCAGDLVMFTVVEGRLAESPEEIRHADDFGDLLLAGWTPELRPPESGVTALIREGTCWYDAARLLRKTADLVQKRQGSGGDGRLLLPGGGGTR